ncbi:hypothetical protein [Salinispora tropica]|uniref:hypothetical protein n=1 Tax=Salinispora tropica TaxID=168695 RepID=UPI00048B35E1|nr:hypothetical protein [Salinispora tropica]
MRVVYVSVDVRLAVEVTVESLGQLVESCPGSSVVVARGELEVVGLSGFESGDGLGGGAGNFGEELVAVVDADGGVSGFDGDDAPGVGDAGVDALAGDDEAAAAAAPTGRRVGCDLRRSTALSLCR